MERASIVQALERIEAALARVENVSRDFAELRQRHEQFKSAVSRSIEEIDQLVAGRPA